MVGSREGAVAKTMCDDHAEVMAALATEREKSRHLEQSEVDLTTALIKLEQRLRKVETSMAKWAGIAACGGAFLGAALPRLLGALIPTAHAVIASL